MSKVEERDIWALERCGRVGGSIFLGGTERMCLRRRKKILARKTAVKTDERNMRKETLGIVGRYSFFWRRL